jgi:hypothetical protein
MSLGCSELKDRDLVCVHMLISFCSQPDMLGRCWLFGAHQCQRSPGRELHRFPGFLLLCRGIEVQLSDTSRRKYSKDCYDDHLVLTPAQEAPWQVSASHNNQFIFNTEAHPVKVAGNPI